MDPKDLPHGFVLDKESEAPTDSPPAGFQLDEDDNESIVQKYREKQEKYGGLGQQAKAGLEGAASAATFGLSTGLETALGVKPEDIRGRREANPITHGAGQVAGLVGTALIPGLGEANAVKAMEGAGALGAKALGLGAAESFAGKVGAGAVRAGVENAAFQAGDEISKMLSHDPNQSVETALTDVGLSALFGGGIGAGLGAVSPLWKVASEGKVGKIIDDFKRGSVDSSLEAASGAGLRDKSIADGLSALKGNAKEIEAAAQEIGAPVLESQISSSKHIQDIDSMLMQSPTPTGVARQQLIQRGLDAAENAVKGTLEGGSNMSQVEVGNALKSGLTKKLEAEYKPISDLYDLVKQSTDHIPVSEKAKEVIAANIGKLEGYKFKGSGMRQVGDSLLENLEHINSVDDIKRFNTDLYNRFKMTAPHEVGLVAEKLKALEEASIVRSAEKMAAEASDPAVKEQVMSLIGERKAANEGYKVLKEKMADLGAVLGKKRPKGTTDFLNFIEDLTPESAAKKLFAKNNSEFLQGFSKNFPEEMQLLVQHQKGVLREAATKDGVINGNAILRELDKLSPEVKKLMFSPDELRKLAAAKTYLDAIPKNINPSGTSKAEAYRRFFTNPASASLESVRDFGLGKLMEHLVPKADEKALYNSVFPAIADGIARGETSPSALKSAINYSMAVIRGENQVINGTKAIFKSTREVFPSKAMEPSKKDRERLDKKVSEAQNNPESLLSMGGETSHYMPNHSVAMAETAGRVLQYLASVKPAPQKLAPLDDEIEPSIEQRNAYNRTLDIAEKPLVVLQHIKDNTLLPEDVKSMVTMYPDLYAKVSQSLTNQMIDHTSTGEKVPYRLRQGLSLFLGQPLDSTFSPAGIMAAQGSFINKNQAMDQSAVGAKKSGSKKVLSEVADRYQTKEQSVLSRQAKA